MSKNTFKTGVASLILEKEKAQQQQQQQQKRLAKFYSIYLGGNMTP